MCLRPKDEQDNDEAAEEEKGLGPRSGDKPRSQLGHQSRRMSEGTVH